MSIVDMIHAHTMAYIAFVDGPDWQMPDPIRLGDLRWRVEHPKPAYAALAEIQALATTNSPGVRWGSRKENGDERVMTQVSPWVELDLRITLDPFAPALINAQSRHAHAGRFELGRPAGSSHPVMLSSDFGGMHRDFRDDLRTIRRARHRFAAKTDILGFYGSVSMENAERALLDAGVPQSVVFAVCRRLVEIQSAAGTDGLPITPEISPLIANLMLRNVDDRLDRFITMPWARWLDDFILAGASHNAVATGLESLETALDHLGLQLSDEKTLLTGETGETPAQLIHRLVVSSADLYGLPGPVDPQLLEHALADELSALHPRSSRLRHMFRILAGAPASDLQRSREIMARMVNSPRSWDTSCPQAAQYMANVSIEQERIRLVDLALDLSVTGEVTDEQVVHSLIAAVPAQDALPNHLRGLYRDRLLNLARSGISVPVAGWARRIAHILDPHTIARRTIDTGEFDDLHAFEQRWAISFADPRWHHWWLEEQANGRWPITAEWRRNTR